MFIQFLVVFIICSVEPFGKMPPPPGTQKVNDTMYIDKNMMSVLDYKEFLTYLKINPRELNIDYTRCLPDSNINYLGKPYLNTLQYEEDYPILNLNEYQIGAYCIWRSYVVNQYKNIADKSKRCSQEYWKKLDKADPLQLSEIEYTLADSTTINLYKPSKRINMPEKFRNEKSTTIKYAQKHFDQDVFGFRCEAKYVLRKR